MGLVMNKQYMLVMPVGVETFPALFDTTHGVKLGDRTSPPRLHNRQIYTPVGFVNLGFDCKAYRMVDSYGCHWLVPAGDSIDSMFRLIHKRGARK